MALSGSETLQVQGVDGAGKPAAETQETTTQAIADLAFGTAQAAYNTNTATASATLTAANITGGNSEVALNLTGTLTAAANATLPTVANLVAALSNPQVGQAYKLRIINSSSGAYGWTVVTNTGWTLGGTMTIAQDTWRDFIVTLTSLTAATLQAVGTGTQS